MTTPVLTVLRDFRCPTSPTRPAGVMLTFCTQEQKYHKSHNCCSSHSIARKTAEVFSLSLAFISFLFWFFSPPEVGESRVSQEGYHVGTGDDDHAFPKYECSVTSVNLPLKDHLWQGQVGQQGSLTFFRNWHSLLGRQSN